MKKFIPLLLLFIPFSIHAQSQKVLFIGNSYTGVNNLPQLVYDVALSAGDTLVFDRHTPGGTRLVNHATNATAIAKINAENWDHVVLQAQSQEPSWPDNQVETEVFPYAKILCDSIRANDPCTRPVFYMTWGRENGDANNCANWPPVCTYQGMDSLLNLRYRMMGNDNEAYVSPVGAVWHYLREQHPNIDLYSSDGSHPSLAGSYAAACTFYAILFEKDPTLISFQATLSDSEANAIKAAAKVIAFDDLQEWNVGAFDPSAQFALLQDGATITFINNSTNANTFEWNFGDGSVSTLSNPSAHTYTNTGTFTVTLKVTNGCETSTFSVEVEIVITAVDNRAQEWGIDVFPNPNTGQFTLRFDGLSGAVEVTLLDISGKELYHWENNNIGAEKKRIIETDDLKVGLYLLKVNAEGGEKTLKLLIR